MDGGFGGTLGSKYYIHAPEPIKFFLLHGRVFFGSNMSVGWRRIEIIGSLFQDVNEGPSTSENIGYHRIKLQPVSSLQEVQAPVVDFVPFAIHPMPEPNMQLESQDAASGWFQTKHL